MTPSDAVDTRPWPNSNRTENEINNTDGQRCSNMVDAPEAASMTSDTTANTLQEISNVGGMNYARTRLLKMTEHRAFTKGRKVRPPALLA